LDWLVSIHDLKFNAILADEMGLGKTIMTISLLAYLASERGEFGQHLIVAPTSCLLNWEQELYRWLPGLKVLCYHGSAKLRREKRRGWADPNAFHVLITSYQLIVQDQHIFKRKSWNYLILDEAQNIKVRSLLTPPHASLLLARRIVLTFPFIELQIAALAVAPQFPHTAPAATDGHTAAEQPGTDASAVFARLLTSSLGFCIDRSSSGRCCTS
jgi:helicase SWR1